MDVLRNSSANSRPARVSPDPRRSIPPAPARQPAPARAPEAPVSNLPKGNLQRIRTLLTGRRLLVLVAGVVVVIAGGFMLWSSQSVLDRKTIASVDFPVYAPRSAPAGYRVQSEQTRVDTNIVTYVLDDIDADRDIIVTVQPRPSGFDMAKLTSGGSVNATATKHGPLYDLSAGGVSKYFLDSGESLIFITSAADVENAAIVRFADSLIKHN